MVDLATWIKDLVTFEKVSEIMELDRTQPWSARLYPWPETKHTVTVVVEPKSALEQRAFKDSQNEWCYYQDWIACGPRARFYGHVSKSGSSILIEARNKIAMDL